MKIALFAAILLVAISAPTAGSVKLSRDEMKYKSSLDSDLIGCQHFSKSRIKQDERSRI